MKFDTMQMMSGGLFGSRIDQILDKINQKGNVSRHPF